MGYYCNLFDKNMLFLLQIIRLFDKDEEKFSATIKTAGLTMLLPYEIRYLREFVHVMQPVALALDIMQRDKNMFAGFLIPTVLSMERELKSRCTLNDKPLKYCGALVRGLIASIRTSRRFLYQLDDNDLRLASALIPCFRLDWLKDDSDRVELKELLIMKAQGVELENSDGKDGTQSQPEETNTVRYLLDIKNFPVHSIKSRLVIHANFFFFRTIAGFLATTNGKRGTIPTK